LKEKLQEKGIIAFSWSDSDPDSSSRINSYKLRTLLVAVDCAMSVSFLNYLCLASTLGKLARVVIDEVHYVLTSEDFRPVFKLLSNLWQISVPMVLLTATLPLVKTSSLLKKLHMLPTDIKIIRASTVLPMI
jgi:superfamily II DNA helicase RecQ